MTDYVLVPRMLGARLDVPLSRVWMNGCAHSSAVINGFSLIFPVGEEMLMVTLAEVTPLLADAKLQKQVAMFLLQEGSHRLEHRRYNQALALCGLTLADPIATFHRLLPASAQQAPLVRRLAACAALEHFTAIFSACVQEQFARLCPNDTAYRRFWMWHTLEELEHRHLTLDVYRALGGGYWQRCLMLLALTVPFCIDTLRCIRAAAVARDMSRWQTARAVWQVLNPISGLSRGAVRRYLAWFKPGFRFDEPAFDGLMRHTDQHYDFTRRAY